MGSEKSSGTAILQDLRTMERKLAVLLELLAAVEGKNAVQAGPRDLCALVEKCRSSDIEVHPAIDAFLVKRELELMEVESDEFKSCLDPKCEAGPAKSYAISILSKDTQVQTIVQRKVICQHLATILETPQNNELVKKLLRWSVRFRFCALTCERSCLSAPELSLRMPTTILLPTA